MYQLQQGGVAVACRRKVMKVHLLFHALSCVLALNLIVYSVFSAVNLHACLHQMGL